MAPERRSQETSASLTWEPSLQVHGEEACRFEHNGRHYYARRDSTGAITRLAKRQRSNGRGLYYQPMNVQGKAARQVLSAVLS